MNMRLLVHPNRVALPVLLSEGILLTRLVIGRGVHVTEVITSIERLIVHVDVYSDILFVDTTVYQTLINCAVLYVSPPILCIHKYRNLATLYSFAIISTATRMTVDGSMDQWVSELCCCPCGQGIGTCTVVGTCSPSGGLL